MNEEKLRQDLFHLIGYLLTSAHGLYDEPKGYGPLRLLDSAGRLLAIMEAEGLSDPFLTEFRQAIDAERFGTSGDETLRAFIDQMCLQYAAELKERVAAASPRET
ncbi:MAG: DUF6092 family protein [Anaerolineae bacterium]